MAGSTHPCSRLRVVAVQRSESFSQLQPLHGYLPWYGAMFLDSILLSLSALIRRVAGAPAPQGAAQDAQFTVSLAGQHFPLLSLPLEVRLQILRYLCPNDDRNTHRTDGIVCSTAIFLINRQVYIEVRDEWYGHVYYRARIHPTGFHMHGYVSSLYKQPPRTLRYIRYLDLEIQLRTPGKMDWITHRKEPLGLYCCKEFLQNCVHDGWLDKLRKLRLSFGVSIVCFEHYRDRIRELKGDLDREIEGLRQLKDLTEVNFTGVVQGHGYAERIPAVILGSSGRDILQAMGKIMEDSVQALAVKVRPPELDQTSARYSR